MRRAATRTSRIPLWTLALLLASVPATAEEAEHAEDIQALYRLSGVEGQFSSMREDMVQMAEARQESVPPFLREVIHRELAPAKLREAYLARFAKEYEPQAARATLAWHRSESGRRIAALEEEADLADLETLQSYRHTLVQELPPPARTELLESLYRLSRVSEFTMELQRATTVSALLVLHATQPSAQPLDAEAMERRVRRQLEWSREPIEELVGLSFVYTYREASDDDLRRYLRFLETEAGSWYVDATSDAFMHAISSFNRELEMALARELENPRDEVSM